MGPKRHEKVMIFVILFAITAITIVFGPAIIGIIFLIKYYKNKMKPTSQTTSVLQGYASTHQYGFSPVMDKRQIKGTVHTISVVQNATNLVTIPVNNSTASLFNLNFIAQVQDKADPTQFINYPISLTVYELQASRQLPNLLLLTNYFNKYEIVPSPFNAKDRFSLEGTEFASKFTIYTKQQDQTIFELFPPNEMARLIDGYQDIAIQFNNNFVSFYYPGELNSTQQLDNFINLCNEFIHQIR